MRIDGKVVLITGASEGIGAACAEEFRRRGARLALAARSADKLAAVAGTDGLAVPTDLLDAKARERLVETTLRHYGRIDVLLNNAGVGLYSPAHVAALEDARTLFELNLFAPLDLVRMVVPAMKERRTGAIVNVGSIAGKMTLPWLTLYSASKYAVGSLTEGLRMELQGSGIHCMTVCPGYVRTGFQEHVIGGNVPEAVRKLKHYWTITPQECARTIARGLERDARTVLAPASGWLLVAFQRLLPSLVERALVKSYVEQGLAT